MIIDAISDLHGFEPELPGGDLLIIAGDCTAADKVSQWQKFGFWLNAQKYAHKVWIAGNHDGLIQHSGKQFAKEMISAPTYLEDQSIEINGLKIYGSPWTPEFCGWHFMLPRGKSLKSKWDNIPQDIDILITHGPPDGILDNAEGRNYDEKTGCADLYEAVMNKKPKIHIFGHIHECGGQKLKTPNTIFYNVACLNENYKLSRGATRIEI